MEQTVYLGTTTTDIVVYAQAIDSSGSHVALVVDTSTTKLVFASGSQSSVVPSVTSLGTGKAKITFASVTNSGNLAAGDTVAVKVNGTADGVAFSEYLIPVFIDSAGGGGGGSAPTEAQIYTYFTSSSREDAFKADVTSLATSADLAVVDNNVDSILVDTGTDIPASIAALNDFDPASDTVIVGTNNDKTGYTISGTKQTLDSLNDVAATDIVSAGAITTLNGAVANVDLVDVTTSNTDMRGTDNAFLAASAPSNFGSLGINASGHILRTVLNDTTTANSDMVSVAGLAQSSEIAALNDISAADVWSYSTRTITSGGITAGEVSDAVWDVSLSGYNSSGSTGKALRQIKEGVISIDGSVNDTSATTTTFISNLSETTDGYYHDKVIVFVSGSLLGQARHIETYTGSTKSITVSQAFTSAPSNGDEFLILATHEHSLNEISEAVWSDTQSSYTVDGTFGYYLDSQVSQAGAGGSGLYQLTVNVTDASSGAALQGARINVDGTTLTLTTDSAGQCVFNLDSGVYLLTISPPAGYDTVSANTVTITTADTSSSFSLTETASSGDCDVPWVG